MFQVAGLFTSAEGFISEALSAEGSISEAPSGEASISRRLYQARRASLTFNEKRKTNNNQTLSILSKFLTLCQIFGRLLYIFFTLLIF